MLFLHKTSAVLVYVVHERVLGDELLERIQCKEFNRWHNRHKMYVCSIGPAEVAGWGLG